MATKQAKQMPKSKKNEAHSASKSTKPAINKEYVDAPTDATDEPNDEPAAELVKKEKKTRNVISPIIEVEREVPVDDLTLKVTLYTLRQDLVARFAEKTVTVPFFKTRRECISWFKVNKKLLKNARVKKTKHGNELSDAIAIIKHNYDTLCEAGEVDNPKTEALLAVLEILTEAAAL